MNNKIDAAPYTRTLAKEEILDVIGQQMNATQRRHGGETDDATIHRSLLRKVGKEITRAESERLQDFGEHFYADICDQYWMGLYAAEDAPYIEEALEVLPDGSVRYTATFLPRRFAPDLPEAEA